MTKRAANDLSRRQRARPRSVDRGLQEGVIDPALGVNVVDLGFVREVGFEEGTASLVMTLTSPAGPLTKVIEDQARTAVVGRTEDRMDLDSHLVASRYNS
jgi:metal-sulfur cluster biosynthetic enzyme